MSKREKRMEAAHQTLKIFQDGFYLSHGKQIDIRASSLNALQNTTLYTEASFTDNVPRASGEGEPRYTLSPLQVVTELKRLRQSGRESADIGILNFASARNPGGGFLNGALAQEESLALCSNLYLTQLQNQDYYDINRANKSMLYTNMMIYSRDVVFIRQDEGDLWPRPLTASVLTAPAVNMGQYLLKQEGTKERARTVMKERMKKVLQIFIKERAQILILGAYGCGVFRNDPNDVAADFYHLLREEGLEKPFQEIVFAVYDVTKSQETYTAFEKTFGALCE